MFQWMRFQPLKMEPKEARSFRHILIFVVGVYVLVFAIVIVHGLVTGVW